MVFRLGFPPTPEPEATLRAREVAAVSSMIEPLRIVPAVDKGRQ